MLLSEIDLAWQHDPKIAESSDQDGRFPSECNIFPPLQKGGIVRPWELALPRGPDLDWAGPMTAFAVREPKTRDGGQNRRRRFASACRGLALFQQPEFPQDRFPAGVPRTTMLRRPSRYASRERARSVPLAALACLSRRGVLAPLPTETALPRPRSPRPPTARGPGRHSPTNSARADSLGAGPGRERGTGSAVC